MSYGIIRIQKFKAMAVRGIQSHDLRERESRSNPDIDHERSKQNYALVECRDLNSAIKERLDTLESTKAVRKDAVVMAQCLVTSDHDFFKGLTPDRQRKFFEQSLAFVASRYGQENILSATVHLDEKTPHMHINLTPLRDGRLTAKEIFNRQEFCVLHTDFHKTVGREWGLERGETREDKRKHLDTEAYKLATRKAKLAKEVERFDLGSVVGIGPEDLEPQIKNKKYLGLIAEKETPGEVANRLTEDFVKRPYEKLKQIPVMREQNRELHSKVESLTSRVSSLESKINDDQISLLNWIDKYNIENSKKEEMEKFFRWDTDANKSFMGWRQENMQKAALKQERQQQFFASWQSEKHKKKQEEPKKEDIVAPYMDKERRRVELAFTFALKNTPGTGFQHLERCKEYMRQWDKASDKPTFEKTTLADLAQQKQKNMGMGYSR